MVAPMPNQCPYDGAWYKDPLGCPKCGYGNMVPPFPVTDGKETFGEILDRTRREEGDD